MALCLEGKAAKGQIWVGFSSVISQETPIPLAPCSEAAQPNHGNPSMHLEDLEAFGMIQTILKYVMEYTEWWGFSDLIFRCQSGFSNLKC